MDIYRNILSMLLRFLQKSFSKSSLNRKMLHDIEWEAEQETFPILGEVEIMADTVIGITKTCLKKKKNANELIAALDAASIYRSETIVNWLATNGDDYPEFVEYILAIENLRMGTIVFLKSDIPHPPN